MAHRNHLDRRSPEALGSVSALPSGRFRAFYRRDGARFSAPHTFVTRAEALDWLAAERGDRARGTWRDPRIGTVTLGQYARDWLDGRPDLAERTRRVYVDTLDRYVLAELTTDRGRGLCLAERSLAELTTADVRAWHAAVFTTARASASARLHRAATRSHHPARAWGRARGFDVPDTGRLSPALLNAWQDAGSPDDRSAPTADPAKLAHAGRSSAARAYGLLRTILNTAVTDGLIATNPCRIPRAGSVQHPPRPIASPAEVAELAALVPPGLAAAVTLAAWSGLRYGELFALARRHVDLRGGTVRVERALIPGARGSATFGKPKTSGSARVVNLPAFVVAVLSAHLDEHTPAGLDALVFCTDDGRSITNARLSFVFRRARGIIGRDDLTWHDLRHTGASLAYRAGASVPEVQARLGHTTMRAASIYAHVADDSDRVLADRLDSLYAETASAAPRLRAV